MIFETKLLNGLELLYKHSAAAQKVGSDIGSFFAKLATQRKEYSKEVVKTIQSFRAKKLVNPALDGTLKNAVAAVLQELENSSYAEVAFATRMEDLAKEFATNSRDYEMRRKKLEANGVQVTKDLEDARQTMLRSKANCHKQAREAEALQASYVKAQSEPTKSAKLSQAQVKSQQATEKARAADSEYRDSWRGFNEKQNRYWTKEMVELLRQYETTELQRMGFLQDSLTNFVNYSAELPPKLSESVETMKSAIASISRERDLEAFAEANATHATIPRDVEYEAMPVTGATPSSQAPPAAEPVKARASGASGASAVSDTGPSASTAASGGGGGGGGDEGVKYVNIKAKALYDYNAESENELTFKEGDMLKITEKHSSGWWLATSSTGQGFIPQNYVEEL